MHSQSIENAQDQHAFISDTQPVETSPLRRALSAHFERFEGLTSPKTAELEHFFTDGEDAIIYKDTASGISA